MADENPTIEPARDGPLLVKGLRTLLNARGESIPTQDTIALCRCGGSQSKPFCDGTHAKLGFRSAKVPSRVRDQRDSYAGKSITIHDNRGICSHAGFCTRAVAAVWRMKQTPWIDPDGADVTRIIAAIESCPSGALSYTVDGTEHRDQKRDPAIRVTEDGPLAVTGAVDLKGEARGESASAWSTSSLVART